MVRPMVLTAATRYSPSQTVFAIMGLFLIAVALAALCAKKSGRSPRSLASQQHLAKPDITSLNPKHVSSSPRSPQVLPKQLVASISNKVMSPRFSLMKKKDELNGEFVEDEEEQGRSNNGSNKSGSRGFGEGGVWQKSILMGDRCRPPQFSGPIYYDSQGNRLQELPRSPRAGPLPTYFNPKQNDT